MRIGTNFRKLMQNFRKLFAKFCEILQKFAEISLDAYFFQMYSLWMISLTAFRLKPIEVFTIRSKTGERSAKKVVLVSDIVAGRDD